MTKYTATTDRLLTRKTALVARLDNAANYVKYGDNGKIAHFCLDRLVADQEALRVYRNELRVLGVHYTREQILNARRYWDSLTVQELFEYYQGTDKYDDFADYLVQSAYESWFCQAYDC